MLEFKNKRYKANAMNTNEEIEGQVLQSSLNTYIVTMINTINGRIVDIQYSLVDPNTLEAVE